MGRTTEINQGPEIGIDRHQDTLFLRGQPEQGCVSGIGRELPRLAHVVTLAAEPLGEPPPGTTVDEKLHSPDTLTASMRSLAITACA
jgi:hypothetical protein